ncbi:FecR family protein [Chitinophaga niastensis]|uniref:FecR family protein n=1 Tax=Chitinophaga niastensis TaxID=536980 RepID=A0A2P8HF20_CHINA|nr:FecR domain-containing protein [Chitinophaga niastensis]PSL44819.1 FecR family protein [Chitinophaga niastensis]
MDQEKLYALLAREMAGVLTEEEATVLQQLLQQYPDASYIREVFARNWVPVGKQYNTQQAQLLLEKHQLRMQEVISTADDTALPAKRPLWLLYTGIAASILTILFVGGHWFLSKKSNAPKELAQLVTARGTRSQLLLPDGSRVWLNAGSKLDYPKQFAKNTPREVTLEGEAFFIVTADASRPFKVHTSAFHIRVLGTSFNVRAYPGEDSAVASLVQGSVEVMLDEAGQQVVALRPNEKLTVPVHPPTLNNSTTTTASPQQVMPVYRSKLTPVQDSIITETAWVQNKLAFKHLELEKVAALLDQWYGVEIGFENDSKKQLYFTGVFETESLEQILDALETTLSFKWTKDAAGKIWIE